MMRTITYAFIVCTVIFATISCHTTGSNNQPKAENAPLDPAASNPNAGLASNEAAPDYSSIGFELIEKETIGPLKIGLPAEDVIRILGTPDHKTKIELWAADGQQHQKWIYINKGIELGMINEDGKQQVDRFEIKHPCNLKTTRNIGIGSTKEAVVNAYKNEIDPSEPNADPSQIIAGTIYGGLIFHFQDGHVSSIFLGARAE